MLPRALTFGLSLGRSYVRSMYTQLAEIPVPTSARFVNTVDKHESSSIVQITYSIKDHARNVKRTMTKSIAISGSPRASVINAMPLQDHDLDIVAQAFSPSRKLRAVLRIVKPGDSPTGTRLVEIWNKDFLLVSANVTDCHGDFYTDEFLASLSFSPTESAILYTAEGKTQETEDPFAKFRFNPDFGEGLVGKKQPVTFIFHWDSSHRSTTSDKPKIALLKLESKENVRFGQAVFSPNSDNVIYATGYEFTSDGRILGIKYCTNRPSGIWQLRLDWRSLPKLDDKLNSATVTTVTLQKLTPASLSCRSPRTFERHGGSTLVWLACPTGGAHSSASALHCLDISMDVHNDSYLKTTETPLVPITNDIPSTPDVFPGLFPSFNLPSSPKIVTKLELEPVPSIVLHSQWGSRTTVLLISTKDGSVVDLTPAIKEEELYSWTVLATDGQSRVVCQRSSTSVPYEIYLGYFNDTGFVSWQLIDKPDLPKHIEEALSTLRTSIVSIPNREPFETILVQSKSRDTPRTIPPLITFPHGGPHGATSTAFSPTTTALALEGYTISLPNYTGSLGYGDGFVQRIIGNCGKLDVEDCYESIRHLIKSGIAEEGPGKQFLTGGSHGGFLTAHRRYPDLFSAAVLRNPVISAGEISSSDIPDWFFSEFGIEYPLSSSSPDIDDTPTTSALLPPLVSPKIYTNLRSASPISHVDSIKIPVLLLIGSADRRVAPSQGVNFYHALKARYASDRARGGHAGGNRKVEMLIFEGESHPLEGVEASKACFEVTKKWLVDAGL